MGVREQLMRHQEALSDSKYSVTSSLQSLFFCPTVTGIIEGYEAEFGIKRISALSKGRTEGFYKIKLKKSLNLPLILSGCFPVGTGKLKEPIRVENKQSLIMLTRDDEKYWESQTKESVRQHFEELIFLANKLQNEDFFLREKIAQAKKTYFVYTLILIAFLGVLAYAIFPCLKTLIS
ncbi:MAG TPA: hypothetical protein PLL75_06525 [Candidatus Omnitrophota bacterium]|nr:hypothetical protein [Candidatus Omnitrophota bacterium]HPS37363.1 hypothetical protein [Candidatus Omnitrophota bacterium]